MIKTLIARSAAFGLLALVAEPALAAEGRLPPDDTMPAARAKLDRPQATEKKYCVVAVVTGSRIPLRTCKTRDQWMRDDDFDPLNP